MGATQQQIVDEATTTTTGVAEQPEVFGGDNAHEEPKTGLLALREMAQQVVNGTLDVTDPNVAVRLAAAVLTATADIASGQTTADAHGDVLGI